MPPSANWQALTVRQTATAAIVEDKVVGGDLVVARCDPPTLLDLIEEPLDQVAGAIRDD